MKKHYLLATAVAIAATLTLQAQVKFKIDFDKGNDRYVVSLIPMQTFKMPKNLTGTAQVTIKAPCGKFAPTDIVGLFPGLEWEYNSRSDAPKEAVEFDYVSFALKNPGLIHLPYVKDQELPVLAFRNKNGCNCPLQLVNNQKDPFMPPNSARANIGNTIAIYGYGIDAYGGVVGEGMVDCRTTFTHESPGKINRFDLYPIPTERELFLECEWGSERETVRAEIVDVLGKVHSFQKVEFIPGHNLITFDVSKLAAGPYFLKLKGKDWEETLDKFQKIRS
jgi:hypothetical protein